RACARERRLRLPDALSLACGQLLARRRPPDEFPATAGGRSRRCRERLSRPVRERVRGGAAGFADAVRTGAASPCPAREALEPLRVAVACDRSCARGASQAGRGRGRPAGRPLTSATSLAARLGD